MMNKSKAKNIIGIGGRLMERKRALPSNALCSRRNFLCSALYLSMALVGITATSRLAVGQSVSFSAAGSYSTDAWPRALVAGDFNSDGKPDIAVASSSSYAPTDYVSILVGKGDGTFQKADHYQVGTNPIAIIAGDFNRDGKLDVTTANSDANNVSVLFGNGDGTFQSAVNYAVEKGPYALVAGDFNRDGYPDIAVVNASSSSVSVLLGGSDGAFKNALSYVVDSHPEAIAVGDFNGDGKADLITANTSGGSVSVLPGNGDGTFQKAINSVSGQGASSVAVSDFNRDGKPDVAVGHLTDPSIKILFGNGDGSFKPPTISFRPGNTPTDIKTGDFNGDGKIDLVSAGIFKGSNVQVFLGKGDGTFSDAGKLMDSVGAVSLSVADFNGDTRPDIAVVINGEVNVVLLNATPGKPDDTSYFVHQHYLDFLSREPDDGGFDYWTNQIDRCGNDPICLRNKRIDTSAAFFIETEFQQSGFFIYRMYRAAFGRRPTYAEFTLDRPKIETGNGMEASQTVLVAAFVGRDQFKQLYPDTLSNAEFVNKLFDSAGLASLTNRQTALTSLNAGASRASVLQSLIQNAAFAQKEYNAAFVQMQYFGYLRRGEDARGYEFWLDVLNNRVAGNFRAMVCAFITSAEYQQRFSAAVTHTDAECAP